MPTAVSAPSSTKQEKKTMSQFEEGSVASHSQVKDAGSFAYAIMFYQGVGQLFPWNAFITAAAYFSQRLCTTNFRDDFENYLSISFTAAQTFGLAVTILYGSTMSYHSRIVVPLYIYCGLFAITTMLVLIEINSYFLFWFTLLACIGCGTAGAFLNGGFFSLSSVFPQEYTGAMMSGQGLAGFSVALTGLITQIIGPTPEGFCGAAEDDLAPIECAEYTTNWSAFSYFTIATLVLASCIALFYVLMKLPFTQYNLKGHEQLLVGIRGSMDMTMSEPLLSEKLLKEVEDSEDGSKISSTTSETSADAKTTLSMQDSTQGSLGLSGIMKRNASRDTDEEYDLSQHTIGINESNVGKHRAGDGSDADDGMGGSTAMGRAWAIFKVIKYPAITVFSIFAVTLSLFPSLTVFLQSSQHCKPDTSRFYNDLFVPMLFVVFNLGDLVGRLLAGRGSALTPDNVHWGGISRLAFYPLLMLCNLGTGSKFPVVFASDLFPYLFTALMAVSNGYVSSSCMMMGPMMVDPEDSPMAGNIMIFTLTAGLMAGSILSFFVLFISQGVW